MRANTIDGHYTAFDLRFFGFAAATSGAVMISRQSRRKALPTWMCMLQKVNRGSREEEERNRDD